MVHVKGEAGVLHIVRPPPTSTSLYVVQARASDRRMAVRRRLRGRSGRRSVARSSTFAPDRGLTRSIVARASLHDRHEPQRRGRRRRSARTATALPEGRIFQARGQHWRTTVAGALIRGSADDFLRSVPAKLARLRSRFVIVSRDWSDRVRDSSTRLRHNPGPMTRGGNHTYLRRRW